MDKKVTFIKYTEKDYGLINTDVSSALVICKDALIETLSDEEYKYFMEAERNDKLKQKIIDKFIIKNKEFILVNKK